MTLSTHSFAMLSRFDRHLEFAANFAPQMLSIVGRLGLIRSLAYIPRPIPGNPMCKTFGYVS
ncbi:MAG TPA: hypothetical protein VG225_07620 [Terracidiphilus sp.]|jgi:hypothetical protein|nr:hypothetical protein [Terracidiphilus sp.]